MRPPGASRVSRVSGSAIGRMPVSSSTVATQMAFDPDMGGVSSGSMMMKPICALEFFGRHQQVDVPEHAAARLVQDEFAQPLVAGDEARHFPQGLARRRGHPADDHIADFSFGMAADDRYDVLGAHGARGHPARP